MKLLVLPRSLVQRGKRRLFAIELDPSIRQRINGLAKQRGATILAITTGLLEFALDAWDEQQAAEPKGGES